MAELGLGHLNVLNVMEPWSVCLLHLEAKIQAITDHCYYIRIFYKSSRVKMNNIFTKIVFLKSNLDPFES